MTVNKRLNAEEIEAIRKRAEAATPGPWFDSETVYVVSNVSGDSIEWDADFIAETQEQSDAEFIAYAREDVPKLLAEIARLQTRLSHAGDILSEAHDLLDDVHCYDTDVYNAISRYFNGEDDSDDSGI
jgi:hypothetical protein